MGKLLTPEEHIKLGKEEFIRSLKETMAVQFATAIRTLGGLPQNQFRDVCRTFALGWSEALRHRRDPVAVHYWQINFGEIMAPGWYPPESWRFW